MIDSLEHQGGRAQRGAWLNGYLSGCHGEPKKCPYVNKSFVRWWENGYEYGAIHRKQTENWKKKLRMEKGTK